MKWYHFGLLFFCVFLGTALIILVQVNRRLNQKEEYHKEYKLLVASIEAAVNASVEEKNGQLFLNRDDVLYAFLETAAILHDSTPDKAGRNKVLEQLVCLVVTDDDGFSVYQRDKHSEFCWSEPIQREQDGGLPDIFFEILQKSLSFFPFAQQNGHFHINKTEEGFFQRELKGTSAFVLFAPDGLYGLQTDARGFLYAASGIAKEIFYVTADGYCHLPTCSVCLTGENIGEFTSQKRAAENGAMPCPICLLPEGFSYTD